jgi:hypothetical protein
MVMAAVSAQCYRTGDRGERVLKLVVKFLVALGIGITLLFGSTFVSRWRHAARHGHSLPFGLHLDVEVTGSSGEGRSYSAALTNYGLVPISVTRCEAVTDTATRESTVAYAVEKREAAPRSWKKVFEVSSATGWCKPFPTGIGEGQIVKRLLWPSQRQSTAPFFWYSAHLAGGLFNAGDEGRFVVFPADSNGQIRMETPSFRVE